MEVLYNNSIECASLVIWLQHVYYVRTSRAKAHNSAELVGSGEQFLDPALGVFDITHRHSVCPFRTTASQHCEPEDPNARGNAQVIERVQIARDARNSSPCWSQSSFHDCCQGCECASSPRSRSVDCEDSSCYTSECQPQGGIVVSTATVPCSGDIYQGLTW